MKELFPLVVIVGLLIVLAGCVDTPAVPEDADNFPAVVSGEAIKGPGGYPLFGTAFNSARTNESIVAIPSQMNNTTAYTVYLNFTNTGSGNWSNTTGFYLIGTKNAPAFGLTKYLFNGSVTTSGYLNFTLNLVAPSTPGTYYLEYQMKNKNMTAFGYRFNQTVTVI